MSVEFGGCSDWGCERNVLNWRQWGWLGEGSLARERREERWEIFMRNLKLEPRDSRAILLKPKLNFRFPLRVIQGIGRS
jgi:hypothetical protein